MAQNGLAQDKALFRYRLIAPLLDPDLKRGDKNQLFAAIAAKTHQLANGRDIKLSRHTIRSWYKRYRKFGFEGGLKNKGRSDRGKSRAVPEEIIQKACDLKLEVPQRTLITIINILESQQVIEPDQLTKSTLHRIFQQKHLTAKIPKEKGYWQRYQAELPNDLWQSDQMSGSYLPAPNDPTKKIRTQLLAWLDDRSRIITHAQFSIPVARPYCPEGKGKIERFFGYVRSSFMPELPVSRISTLEQLNEAFWAWLDLAYLHRQHSELDAKPLEAFLAHKDKLRYPTEAELKDAFLYRETRKIHKDCTFSLLGNYYEVMPALVRQEVEIHFDPDDPEMVKVYLAGDFFQQAGILRLPPQRRTKEGLATEGKGETGINYLKALVTEHKNRKAELLFGPKVAASDNRFTLIDLLSLLERKGFHLSSFERKETQKYFDTYGPFTRELANKTLEQLIELKGTKQHISFYLEKLAAIQIEKRQDHD